jgi:NADPH2:quinone reductase
MAKAVRIHETGGPEVLRVEDLEVPAPGPGEVRLKQSAIGLNYIDTYHRDGSYPVELPVVIGLEAAGVVTAVGEGAGELLKEGDRVAYASPPLGAYAAERVIPADRVVKLPDTIDDRTAAAMMLKGMTVEYLIRRTYPVRAGQTVLFHAASGGVGLIACQWLKHLGVSIIGTVGSAEKGSLAKEHGCTHVINYREENFVERVRELTGGKGVPVVYDGVGKDTFNDSLDCIAPRGMMVNFGAASGPVPPLAPGILAQKGSLYLTRPTIMTYNASRTDLVESAMTLFEVVSSGAVKIEVKQTYPLDEIQQAHRDLEARKTTGSTVILP